MPTSSKGAKKGAMMSVASNPLVAPTKPTQAGTPVRLTHSGLAGYMARARYERLSSDKRLSGDEIKLIENQTTIPAQLEKRHEK